MNELIVRQLQEYISLRYYGKATSTGLYMKLAEEMGELAEVLNKIDGRKLNTGDTSIEKELADIIHYAVAIAVVNDIDLTSAIIEKDITASIKYNQSPNLSEYIQAQKDDEN